MSSLEPELMPGALRPVRMGSTLHRMSLRDQWPASATIRGTGSESLDLVTMPALMALVLNRLLEASGHRSAGPVETAIATAWLAMVTYRPSSASCVASVGGRRNLGIAGLVAAAGMPEFDQGLRIGRGRCVRTLFPADANAR